MTLPEAIDTTRIHRVAGRTGDRLAWVTTRPCRAPHHTISDVGLIGGGQVSLPGEGSLAHNRVLFAVPSPERVPCWGCSLNWSSIGLHGTPPILKDLPWRLRRGHLVGGHDGPPNDQAMAPDDLSLTGGNPLAPALSLHLASDRLGSRPTGGVEVPGAGHYASRRHAQAQPS
jgi:Magnesium chelatase, subunit ChlI